MTTYANLRLIFAAKEIAFLYAMKCLFIEIYGKPLSISRKYP